MPAKPVKTKPAKAKPARKPERSGTTKLSGTRLPPDQRRAQLIQCAIAALAEHGVARATHGHVAKRANVSVAAVHSYFRTRDDLVEATLSEVEAALLKIVADSARQATSTFTGLSEMVSGLDRAARETPDIVKVWLDWSTGFRADVWPRYALMQEQLYAAVRKVLTAGKRQGSLSEKLNVKAAARLFVGGGHTVVLARFGGASQDEIEILIEYLIGSVMNIGIAPAEA